uniref:Kinesin motor domain-containing protein n=1 Tax=Leersia perrieri TaxID=77586 RepID=A0A0D9WEL0_9ORYZ
MSVFVVQVVVRVRPAVSLPTDGKDLFFVRKTSPSSVAVGDRSFAVDGFLDDRASQADAFDLVGVPMIESALAGFNSSLVCYGQCGEPSRPWFTAAPTTPIGASCLASSRTSLHKSKVEKRAHQRSRQATNADARFLRSDMMQILLCAFQIRENADNGILVENLTDEYVSTVEDVNQILMKDELIRTKSGDAGACKNASASHQTPKVNEVVCLLRGCAPHPKVMEGGGNFDGTMRVPGPIDPARDSRWVATLASVALRVYLLQGFYIVTFFISPMVDPEANAPVEFKPFTHRLPEFNFWSILSPMMDPEASSEGMGLMEMT